MHQYISLNIELRELINEGVAEVTTKEEERVNMGKSVTMEHCLGGKETQETTRRRKKLLWILYSIKERRYFMKGRYT